MRDDSGVDVGTTVGIAPRVLSRLPTVGGRRPAPKFGSAYERTFVYSFLLLFLGI